MSGTVLAIIFVALGAASWLAEHRAQRHAGRCLQAVHAPRWAAWLCGNPRGDNTLDLEHGVRQLTALVFLLGGPLALLWQRTPHMQAGLVFTAYVAVALPATIWVERARQRAEQERNMLMDTPEPGRAYGRRRTA